MEHHGRLFAGTLHGGRLNWNWLRFVPHYGSGSAVGIAANGDVAGEIHGLIRKPHCCKSLQQAVIWRPAPDGSYRFPYFVPGAKGEATAIWSDGKSGETIVAGKVVNRMAIWTLPPRCPPNAECAHSVSAAPVVGASFWNSRTHTDGITAIAVGDGKVYAAGQSFFNELPTGRGWLMRLVRTADGSFRTGVEVPLPVPSEVPGCDSLPFGTEGYGRAEQWRVHGHGRGRLLFPSLRSQQQPCTLAPIRPRPPPSCGGTARSASSVDSYPCGSDALGGG